MAKKGLIQEFKEFVLTGDLVAIATAFIIGAATAALVTSFTKDIAMGIVGLFVKCKDLADGSKDCSGLTGKAWKSVQWGNFLNNVVTFLIILGVVFLIVKAYRKAVAAKIEVAGPSEADLLGEILAELKKR